QGKLNKSLFCKEASNTQEEGNENVYVHTNISKGGNNVLFHRAADENCVNFENHFKQTQYNFSSLSNNRKNLNEAFLKTVYSNSFCDLNKVRGYGKNNLNQLNIEYYNDTNYNSSNNNSSNNNSSNNKSSNNKSSNNKSSNNKSSNNKSSNNKSSNNKSSNNKSSNNKSSNNKSSNNKSSNNKSSNNKSSNN
ncbi:hypothetical protein PMLGA01_120015500, partial [Plasmodium malariae]